ncbi:hypothetical protein H6G89_29660 [Oscillatoria sp. FACHB-1407]|uniref:hypothetical protein n=1 Tax=Oscillatoria sp. FACHB-1407 TaxID=2692847 RepID=UPI0016874D1E|nr:hypothetical protein [Oscillatoria sp. FACHB-1407]MBD2465179.1 hypothetical protein [Oscillatoria sp. FACHB-1407]
MMKTLHQQWQHTIRLAIAGGLGWIVANGVGATGAIASEETYVRPTATCPTTVAAIMPPLLRDLPSYTNRAIQRSRRRERTYVPPGYVLIAGNPEFAPLSLGPGEYVPTLPDDEVQQVFFTTLERRYVANTIVRQQNYHWIFLTETSEGWQLVTMLSRSGGYVTVPQPPSPPEDTSQGAIAQGIREWLRDCRAGDIVPME